MNKIELTLSPRPSRCRIIVDGVDLSNGVNGVTVRRPPGEIPVIELQLPAMEDVRIDGQARVVIADATRDVLARFGWSEPGQYAHLAQAIRDLLDAISDMPVRNSDVDDAALILRGELSDAGWDEQT